MATISQSSLKRAAFGAVSALVLTGTVAIGSSSAQSAEAGCSGDYVADVSGGILASYSNSGAGWATSYTFPASIPAGQYDLNGVSGDAYAGRSVTQPQPNERWFVQLMDASGNVVATSGTTADVQDGVEAASWSGGLGLVSFNTDVVSIRTVHAYQTNIETNSVIPSCVGFTLFQEAATPEAPEPTVPETPEVTTPEVTEPAPEPTTPEVTEPTTPEPEPEVEATPTAAAQTAPANDRPSFTG